MVILVSALLVWLVRLYRELQKHYLDVFKIIQWVSFSTAWAINLISNILLLADPSNVLIWMQLSLFVPLNIVGFQITNIFCWLTMILHLNKCKDLLKATSYGSVRQSIKKREKIYLAIIWSYFIVSNLYALFNFIVEAAYRCQYWSEETSTIEYKDGVLWSIKLGITDYIGTYVMLALYIFMIIIALATFGYLLFIMKQNLHYYYKQKKLLIIFLAVLSITYFTFKWLTLIPLKYLSIEQTILKLEHRESSYSLKVLILAFVVNFCANIPMFVYVFFHIKGINFKIYLSSIMQGHSIFSYYDNASIFIRRRNLVYQYEYEVKYSTDERSSLIESKEI